MWFTDKVRQCKLNSKINKTKTETVEASFPHCKLAITISPFSLALSFFVHTHTWCYFHIIWNLSKLYMCLGVLLKDNLCLIHLVISFFLGQYSDYFNIAQFQWSLCHSLYSQKHIVQVWCMKQGTQSWCSGTTQRDSVGREVEGGFSMGGRLYTCGQFMLMYGKNHHIVR